MTIRRLRKQKVLITGGMGFIGSNLVKRLGVNRCIIWDKKVGLDIFEDKIEDYIKNAQAVYHLAALTNVSESFKRPERTHMVNVIGTARIARLCAKYGVKLIYPSSASVYVKDSSPYAHSKYLAEEIVKGLKTPRVILRLFNVFGEGMNKDSGSIMYNFLHDRRLVIYGDGEQTRDFIHVRDVVAIMQDSLKKKWNGLDLDIATGEEISINYVAQLFKYYRKLKNVSYKPPRKEIRWSSSHTELLNKVYRENLTTHLEHDIEKLVRTK